jgi:excisionase family DNA binding protein
MALLSTREVADALGVSVRRVQAMIASGRLRAQKVGTTWVVQSSALASVEDRPPGRPRKSDPAS